MLRTILVAILHALLRSATVARPRESTSVEQRSVVIDANDAENAPDDDDDYERVDGALATKMKGWRASRRTRSSSKGPTAKGGGAGCTSLRVLRAVLVVIYGLEGGNLPGRVRMRRGNNVEDAP